jgi:hypothetical protein
MTTLVRNSAILGLALGVFGLSASAAVIRPAPGFELNLGQSAAEVKFLSHGPSASVFATEREVVLAFAGGKALRMQLPGHFSLSGQGMLGYKTNYPGISVTGVDNFKGVWFHSKTGLDLDLFYDPDQRLTYEWHVAPDVAVEKLQWKIDGADRIDIDPNGDLLITTGTDVIRQSKPLIYQRAGAGRVQIVGSFRLLGHRSVGFSVAEYDRRRELIIDPTVYFASHPGRAGDSVSDLAIDTGGNTYLTGLTGSEDFPGGAPSPRGLAPYVVKFSPDGSQILFRTFLGGGAAQSRIAVDRAGNVFLAGYTGPGAYIAPTPEPILIGPGPAFAQFFGYVVKLDPSGSTILYQSIIGTSLLLALIPDESGGVYISGTQVASLGKGVPASAIFPVTPGAFRTQGGGGIVAKIDSSGKLVWGSFAAGAVRAMALDSKGQLIIAGATTLPDFPATSGAFQTTNDGGPDAALIKVSADGSRVIFATLLGGIGDDRATAVAVDPADNIYVAGTSTSPDFPTTTNRVNQGPGSFVAKLDATGSRLLYSTNFFESSVSAVTVDALGRVYFAGDSNESLSVPTLPAVNAIQSDFFPVRCYITDSVSQSRLCSNGFVSGIDTVTGSLLFSTWLQDTVCLSSRPPAMPIVAGWRLIEWADST